MSDRFLASRWALFALAMVLSLAPLLAICAASSASALPGTTRLLYAPGKIVPIPASVPHEAGDMVDRRIVPDLLWIARRYPIYVTDGYSGPLPNGEHVGCNRCHVRGSDHYNGLAVDLVPLHGDGRCDATWAPINRLAHWAEPRQNHPIPPFRWVGYNGDPGHGCGNHLHLSWNHSPAPEYHLAEWVEVFPAGLPGAPASTPKNVRSGGAGAKKGQAPPPAPAPPAPAGPSGGVSQISTGGLAPDGGGD